MNHTLTEQEIAAAILQAKKKQYHQDLMQNTVRAAIAPPINYHIDYSTYPLTDEEQQNVIVKLVMKKESEVKTKQYFERIKKASKWDGITEQKLFNLLQTRLQNIIGSKQITEYNAAVLQQLVPYLMGIENEHHDISKGLIFIGGTGTGKTAIMAAIHDTPMGRFDTYSCELISEHYAANSGYFYEQYVTNNYQNNICYDDMGFEKARQQAYQKGVDEPMLIALVKRHELGMFRNTRITTNLNGDMIEQRYGQRLRSRLREMCNVIILNGKDLRV